MRIKADVTFEADSLDDAFKQWGKHFENLLAEEEQEEPVVDFLGEITIEPVTPNDEVSGGKSDMRD